MKGYKENKDVLRFHYHKVDSLYKNLQELALPRKEYTSNLTELPQVHGFITEDEVLATISRGSGFDQGKERITKYFKESHTLQEKANFLKDEYGIGGHSHAVSGQREVMNGTMQRGLNYRRIIVTMFFLHGQM
ncbi:hypothetical protein KK420_06570 [Clostridioides difficile]|nr:hypothetical protein [Clostridioides difficile]